MKKVNIVMFLSVLLIFAGTVTLFPADERVIENENRSFNRFPELTAENVFGGEFGKQFEEWIADRVGYRADFVSASMSIVDAAGVDPPAPRITSPAVQSPVQAPSPPVTQEIQSSERDEEPQNTGAVSSTPPSSSQPSVSAPQQDAAQESSSPSLSLDQDPEPEQGEDYSQPSPETSAQQPSESSEPPQASEPTGLDSSEQQAAEGGSSETTPNNIPQGAGRVRGSLLVFDDRIAEIFPGNSTAAIRYSEVLNLYRDSLGEETRIFSILVPIQIAFLPEVYSELADSQIYMIETVNSLFVEGITPVDAYGALQQHAHEYVYYRTDHHWTALGAYYAYTAFAQAAGIPAIPLSEYDVIEVPNFLGYLYNQAPSESLRRNPDTIYAYRYKGELETSVPLLRIPSAGQAATYRLFLGGDHPSLTITTSAGNGRTAVIVKDSYANCFVPWLAPHYERIILLDPRSYERSVVSVVDNYEDVDLIFLTYTLAVSYGVMVEYISRIM